MAVKKISILNMQNDEIIVNGNSVLAFEPSLKWDIKLMKLSSMMAGGLTNIQINGTGMLAITTAYDPLTLKVPLIHLYLLTQVQQLHGLEI